jgi:cytochrome c-type biogenesis protein CcmE
VNKRAKQRLIGVTILVLVMVGALIVGLRIGNASAMPVTIGDVLNDSSLVGKQVEVSGQVVAGSWVSGSKPFVFEIQDEKDTAAGRLRIEWNDQVPGSFGDGVTATVTGVVGEDGTIKAKYLITKCPSKYQSATGALTVNDITARAGELTGKTVKVSGFVVAGSIGEPGAAVRFRIADDVKSADGLDVAFGGGLSDEFVDGAKVVITGSLESDGVFQATEVALEQTGK